MLFFILPASGEQDARLRRRRYDVEAKLELSRPQNPLCSSLRTSTQIHAGSSSTAHSLGVEVDLNLAAAVFPNRTSFFTIQASGAWSSPGHARPATWQLVVLVPRSTETHVAKSMAISRNESDSEGRSSSWLLDHRDVSCSVICVL